MLISEPFSFVSFRNALFCYSFSGQLNKTLTSPAHKRQTKSIANTASVLLIGWLLGRSYDIISHLCEFKFSSILLEFQQEMFSPKSETV